MILILLFDTKWFQNWDIWKVSKWLKIMIWIVLIYWIPPKVQIVLKYIQKRSYQYINSKHVQNHFTAFSLHYFTSINGSFSLLSLLFDSNKGPKGEPGLYFCFFTYSPFSIYMIFSIYSRSIFGLMTGSSVVSDCLLEWLWKIISFCMKGF